MNTKDSLILWGLTRLNEVKPPADASDFLMVFYRASSIKIRAQIRWSEFDYRFEQIKGAFLWRGF